MECGGQRSGCVARASLTGVMLRKRRLTFSLVVMGLCRVVQSNKGAMFMKRIGTKSASVFVMGAAALLMFAGCAQQGTYSNTSARGNPQSGMATTSNGGETNIRTGGISARPAVRTGAASTSSAPTRTSTSASNSASASNINTNTSASNANATTKPAPATTTRPEQANANTRPTSNMQASTPKPTITGDGMARAVLAYPTGDERTSALLVEKFMPVEVRAGQPFTYELRTTNLTNMELQNVVVNDAPTGALTIRESEPSFNRDASGAMAWTLGNLSPRETRTVRVTAVAGGTGAAGSCTTASYNTSMCMTTNVVQPALQLTKTVSPEVGTPCDTYETVYRVCNTGTGTIDGVMVRDMLPAGFTIDGKSEFAGNAGSLAAGECKTFTLRGKASAAGSYCSAATATGGDLTAQSEQPCLTVRQPELQVAVNCANERYFGAPATFNVVVRNTGSAPAENVVVSAPVPAGTAFASASDNGRATGNSIGWNIGTLAPGASREINFGVNPNGATTVTGTVRVTGACANDATATCSTQFRGIPAVLLEVVDGPDPVLVGEQTTYVITVTNQGTAQDTDIQIRATLPTGAEFVSAAGDTRGTFANGTVTFAALPVLAPKQQAQWRIVVKAAGTGDVRFRVEMDTKELDSNVTETEATRFYNF